MTSGSGPDMRDRATPGISAADITVTYRNGVTALSNATFEVPRGSIAALVGVNGAGKSTLFKAIMGFVPAAKGSISVLGLPVKEALRRNMVAYVPQSEEVDWSFPVLVEDVVMMGRYGHMGFLRRPSAEDRKEVAEALARVDMTSYAKRQIGELSGGQRKRVFLARALAQQADVVLLDEPFTGIDVKTEEAIVKLLRSMRDEGRVIGEMLVLPHFRESGPYLPRVLGSRVGSLLLRARLLLLSLPRLGLLGGQRADGADVGDVALVVALERAVGEGRDDRARSEVGDGQLAVAQQCHDPEPGFLTDRSQDVERRLGGQHPRTI